MQRTMRHSLREAIEVVMDSVFPPLFRRGMRLALPAFLLICLEFWPVSGAGAASRTADALSPAPSTPPTQGAARAPVPPGMQRIYVFDSMDKSLTPMLCRPEDPAIPAAKEGRLGIRTGTGTPAASPVPVSAPPAKSVPAAPPSPVTSTGSAPVPALFPASPALSPVPAAPGQSIQEKRIVPGQMEREIQTIWKYYARRKQAYLPRGEGPLWGPSPDPAARRRVPEFSRTHVRTSSPASSGRIVTHKVPAQSQAAPAPRNIPTPAQGGEGTAPQGVSATPSPLTSDQPAPPVTASRSPSVLAPAANSAAPPMPAPSVPATRSLGR